MAEGEALGGLLRFCSLTVPGSGVVVAVLLVQDCGARCWSARLRVEHGTVGVRVSPAAQPLELLACDGGHRLRPVGLRCRGRTRENSKGNRGEKRVQEIDLELERVCFSCD